MTSYHHPRAEKATSRATAPETSKGAIQEGGTGSIRLSPDSSQCAMCGGEALTHYQPKAFDGPAGTRVSITECDACAFAWQYPPARSAEESVDFFANSYSEAGSPYFDPAHKTKIADLEAAYLDELPLAGHRLLDVGAGAGIFARAAADRGYSVTAVDPSMEKNSTCVADRGDIQWERGTITDLAGNQIFDVITLWDVIEHLPDPLGVLGDIRARLAPEGVVVLETGNFKSADRVEGGQDHWMYQLDHRWYFAPESLRQLLHWAGLEVIDVCDRVLRPGWSGTPSYPGPSRKALVKQLLRRPLSFRQSIERYQALNRAATWDYSGIGIVTMAARKIAP